ncbi:MAG: hypothetical protein R3F65_32145 [bacterium]
MTRLTLATITALAALAGCAPPIDTACRCLDGTGEVAVELGTFTGLEVPAPGWQLRNASYRIDLDPAAALPDDPRVFARARVPALVEIEIYASEGDWLRLYLPQDDEISPVGTPSLDASAIVHPFIGGELGGERVVLDEVSVTLDAELGDARIAGSFSATGGRVTIAGDFAGETAVFCKPREPLERTADAAENGWHRPPFRESPSCLKVLHTLYGE